MHTTFKTGLDCKACTTHKPLQTVDVLYPEMPDLRSVPEKNLALKVNGVFICCKCGTQIGTDDDREIPSQVAEILRVLMQDCTFYIESISDYGDGHPRISLYNPSSAEVVNCYITWHRDPKWSENPDRPTVLHAQTLDVSTLKRRPPAAIEHTLRALIRSKSAVLTEMPKADKGYAHLGTIIREYATRLGDRAFPEHEWDFNPVRKHEQTSAPLVVQIQLCWPTLPDDEARSKQK